MKLSTLSCPKILGREYSILDSDDLADPGDHWTLFYNLLNPQPICYSTLNLNYHEAYLRGLDSSNKLVKLLILKNGIVISMWAFTAKIVDNKIIAFIPINGEIYLPIFLNTVVTVVKKKIFEWALNLISKVNHGKKEGSYYMVVDPEAQFSAKNTKEAQGCGPFKGLEYAHKNRLICDLTIPMESIYSGFRKSYKSLVQQSLRLNGHRITSSHNYSDDLISEFERLHLLVAGKATRSNMTWKIQGEMVKAGEAFIVSAHPKNGRETLGMGFFQISRDEGLYAVGAYCKITNFSTVAHSIQYLAIQEMKRNGVKQYCLASDFDLMHHDEKIRNINFFKKGFSTSSIVVEGFQPL